MKLKFKDNFKLGDLVYCSRFPNEIFTINRIDGHVYPFCIGIGVRASTKELKLVNEEKYV